MIASELEKTIHSTRRAQEQRKAAGESKMPGNLKLWIDGVGSYLVFLEDRMTIGSERSDGVLADLRLQAGIKREHATIERVGEDYWLNPLGTTKINQREVQERSLLQEGYEISLLPCVRLRFSLPSALSSSARIDFLTAHRPAERIDGIVLMSETCLIGPGQGNHITCPKWGANMVLYRQDEDLYARCRTDWSIDGVSVSGAARLNPGNIIAGPDFRFRLEQNLK
jgi:FHA domain